MDTEDSDGRARLTAVVSGTVQGVGFRFSTMAFAKAAELVGFAENQADGDVLVVVEGGRDNCEQMLAWLEGRGSKVVRRPGRVTFVDASWGSAEGGFRGFSCR